MALSRGSVLQASGALSRHARISALRYGSALTRKSLCFVAAADWPLKMFLREQIRALAMTYDVTAVVNTEDPGFLAREGIPIRIQPLRIERKIAPVSDVLALLRLIRHFIASRYDVVHSINPKSGLLAMLAAFIARTPVRIHTFTGQVWVTRKGPMRWLLKSMDRVIATLATQVVIDSPSQLEFLCDEGVLCRAKGFVPGHGSVGGVDISRFTFNAHARTDIRRTLGIAEGDIAFLFVGRMTRDKGICELAKAFTAAVGTGLRVSLILVGPDEDNMKLTVLKECANVLGNVHFIEYTDHPEQYMAASDVLCIPSHREGFGNVVIEAAAVGLPSVGSRIYGLTDAIVEGETGLLHDPGDVDALAEKMLWIATHEDERRQLGAAARERARRDFSHAAVTTAMLDFYARVIPS